MVLRRHGLTHVPELRVDATMLARRFAPGCTTRRCDATCCRDGVWADPQERERILAHAGLIQRVMDADQEHDPAQWFDEEAIDPDFPSGRAVGTSVRDDRCVFLNRGGRCVLQTASLAGGPELALKPFFCTAFPLTLQDGTLTVDEPSSGECPQCCTASSAGSQTVFDVWPEELEYVLGVDGVTELRRHAEQNSL